MSREIQIKARMGINFHAFDGQNHRNLWQVLEWIDTEDFLYTADGNVNLEKFDIIYWSWTLMFCDAEIPLLHMLSKYILIALQLETCIQMFIYITLLTIKKMYKDNPNACQHERERMYYVTIYLMEYYIAINGL